MEKRDQQFKNPKPREVVQSCAVLAPTTPPAQALAAQVATQVAPPNLSTNDRSDLTELSQGVAKVFENAQELFKEAAFLRSRGALSRALFMHQISMEECGKIEILGATAVSLLAGHDPDLKLAARVVTQHKTKNYANAYLLPATVEEKEARESGDWRRALEAFREHQATFHRHSNTAKNSSLYVDFTNGRFTAPKEAISEEMVRELGELNREFLAMAELKVRMLARWQTDTDEVSKMVQWFVERAEALKADPNVDPHKAMSVLISEMRDLAKESKYHQIARGAHSATETPSEI